MQVLKRTGEELSQGQSRLKGLVEKMKREEEELDRDTAILNQKKEARRFAKKKSNFSLRPSLRHYKNVQPKKNQLILTKL